MAVRPTVLGVGEGGGWMDMSDWASMVGSSMTAQGVRVYSIDSRRWCHLILTSVTTARDDAYRDVGR